MLVDNIYVAELIPEVESIGTIPGPLQGTRKMRLVLRSFKALPVSAVSAIAFCR